MLGEICVITSTERNILCAKRFNKIFEAVRDNNKLTITFHASILINYASLVLDYHQIEHHMRLKYRK